MWRRFVGGLFGEMEREGLPYFGEMEREGLPYFGEMESEGLPSHVLSYFFS
jgi:hypothetical protein